jgi:hypothetical protein
VDYANALNPMPNWTALGSVSLTSTPQYYFDLTWIRRIFGTISSKMA